MMSTQEIAEKLVSYCRSNDWRKAYTELFAKDALSIEEEAGGGFEKETRGLDNLIAKGEKFDEMVEELYDASVSEPVVAKNSFVTHGWMDIKMKGMDRMEMEELCLYKVKDGKIVSEEFFM